jgi:hypothetical protein
MNKINWQITLVLITILGINVLPSQSHALLRMGSQLISQALQETSVDVDSANLRQPHILRVSGTNNAYLTGNIKLNGKTIASLAGGSKEVNLSSYLQRGVNIIEVSSQYSPVYATIKIEFSAPGTSVSQQTSGKGTLAQKIIVRVE